MKFEAEVRRIRTMADMTVDVTFNLPEYQIDAAKELLAMIGDLVAIDCQIIGTKLDDGSKQRRKR